MRDGAIWGRVEWTERAAAAIRAREYRFLSPSFGFDKPRSRSRGARVVVCYSLSATSSQTSRAPSTKPLMNSTVIASTASSSM